VVLVYMAHLENSLRVNVGQLKGNIQMLADNLFDEGHLTAYECCSLETIGNALDKLIQKGLVEKQEVKGGELFYQIEP